MSSVAVEADHAKLGYALVALAATGWGMWPVILRHAPMPAELQSALFMVVVTLASAPILRWDRVRVKARLSDWALVGWLGIADAANVGLFFAAYQHTTVAIAVLTHYLTPILVALGAPLILRERLRRRTKVAVAVSFGGLVLLLEPWRTDLAVHDLVGAALGAGSAVFYASNVLVNKRLARVFSGTELMFFHGFVSIPLLASFVPRGALLAASSTAITIVVLAALGVGMGCGLLFVWGLRRIPASHASVLTLLEPFIAVVMAMLFLGQRMGLVSLVGAAWILAGAVLVVTGGKPWSSKTRQA